MLFGEGTGTESDIVRGVEVYEGRTVDVMVVMVC